MKKPLGNWRVMPTVSRTWWSDAEFAQLQGWWRHAGIPAPKTASPLVVDGKPGYLITTTDVWVEADIDSRWVAAFRVMQDRTDGRLTLGETRIIPREPMKPGFLGGGSRADATGFSGTPKAGPVRTSAFRRVSARAGYEALRKAQGIYAREASRALDEAGSLVGEPWLSDTVGYALQLAGRSEPVRPKRTSQPRASVRAAGGKRGRGRPALPDRHYAELARDYAALCAQGKNPILELTRTRKQSKSTVQSAVRTARERRLLTEGRPGLSGGSLTDHGREVLRRKP